MKCIRICTYVFVFLLSGILLLYNLDDRLLWGDEAETALLAVNITKTGLPKVTDGKNVISLYGLGVDSNADHIWTHRPFLDLYVTAASFLVFGKNTFAARFPFSVIGFFTVILLAIVTYRIYNNHALTLMTTLLMCTNIVFLLHTRQCRYYAIMIFLQVSLFYGYDLLIKRNILQSYILISLSLIGQFYCNYLIVVCNVAGIIITSITLKYKYNYLLKHSIINVFIVIIFSLPWLIYAHPFYEASAISMSDFLGYLIHYCSIVNVYIVPLVILIIPLLKYITYRFKKYSNAYNIIIQDSELFIWIMIPVTIVIVSFVSVYFIRYTIQLIPLAALIIGSILTYHISHKFLRYLLFSVLCFTNAISAISTGNLDPKALMQVPILEYVREITQHYEDRLLDVVTYLKEHGTPEQSVLVKDPEFPLIFYTDMRVVDIRIAAREQLPGIPDWVLSTSPSGVNDMPPIEINDENIKNSYEIIYLRVHDSKRGGSMPDPRYREPFTSDRFTTLKIYKKK